MQPDTCAAGSARHMSSKKGRDQQEYRTGGGYCDPKRNGITRAASLFSERSQMTPTEWQFVGGASVCHAHPPPLACTGSFHMPRLFDG
ncbi:hypothetical protein ROHU_015151 [Labeo rohita]|uniref:Uncharacterized protein n=1 Tax=Labeo rohita TaxID=84645 RepID=A0A498NQN5_LABRO|nr:hypothetical protein ROHU_015151 [Labeo rohita]